MSIKGIGTGGSTPIKPPSDPTEAKETAKLSQSPKTAGDQYESAASTTPLGALLGQPRGAAGDDHVIAIAPGEDRGVKIKPGEEQGVRFAPGEDRGVKIQPGEEQGVRFAPGEDRGVKLDPGLGAWGDPHVASADAGEVRSTGLSPAAGEVRATGLSPATAPAEHGAAGPAAGGVAVPSKPASGG